MSFVINTHWHGDHTGGNAAFGRTGSVIVAHDNVRRRMNVESVNGFSGGTSRRAREALPIVTFDQAVTLHYNGDELAVVHVANAHTDGDAIIYFRKANVVHMGDTFFNGFYPFIDNSSGGTLAGMVVAADAVLARIDDKTRVMPGHGPLASKSDLQAYRDMLATVRERVSKLVAAGKSQDEVLAAKPTADFDARWGGGFFKPNVCGGANLRGTEARARTVVAMARWTGQRPRCPTGARFDCQNARGAPVFVWGVRRILNSSIAY